MPHETPAKRPSRRRVLFASLGGCLLLILAGWGVANSDRLLVWYHMGQMNLGWKENWAQPKERAGNLTGVTLGEAWERYEKARDRLVELGAYCHARYRFQVLKEGSADRRHLLGRLINESSGTEEVAPSPYWTLPESPDGLAMMEIWGPPDEVEQLLVDLKTHDVADYGERFRKPSVLAQAQDYIKEWPNLGMWLPNSREVEFFRKNYDLTRGILKAEIRNADVRIRRNALYVVSELTGTARDLGPDIIEILASAPAGQPDLSAVRALTGIRHRSPEGQKELNRHWDAVALVPEGALTIAAAQYALSESAEERQRAEAFILRWLQPVPDHLDAAERKAYLNTQFNAVMCIKLVPGFKAVEAPLKRLLKNPAAFWMRTQIPDALNQIRTPADDAPPP